MHRLTEFQHHVVGYIHNRAKAADTPTTQLFLHPQRRLSRGTDAADNTPQVTRTRVRRLHINWKSVVATGGNWFECRWRQIRTVQGTDFTRHTFHSQAVTTIRRQVNLDSDIIEAKIVAQITAHRRITR